MQTIRHFALPLGLAAALATSIALAQPAPGYTGPSAAPAPTQAPGQASGYTGPSSVQLMTVKQLLDTGKDDQHARLQGRIVSHTTATTSTRSPTTPAASRWRSRPSTSRLARPSAPPSAWSCSASSTRGSARPSSRWTA